MMTRVVEIMVWLYFFSGMSSSVAQSSFQNDSNTILELKGQWDFAWHQLVDASTDTVKDWHTVSVPGSWDEYDTSIKPKGPFGYGTFRQQIIIRNPWSNIGIQIPDVQAAHSIYADSILLFQSGQVATGRESEKFGNFNRLLQLPEGYSKGDTLTLYLQVSNFHYRKGGIMRPLQIGAYPIMKSEKDRNAFYQAFQMGSVAAIALFVLLYASFRKKERYIYVLVLLCIGIFFYDSLNGEFLWLVLFPNMDGAWVMHLTYLSFYLGITLHFYLVTELFKNEFPVRIVRTVLAIGLLFASGVILLPMSMYSYTMPWFQGFAIISGFYLIAKVFQLALKNKPGAKILAAGITIIFIFLINEILYAYKIIETRTLFGWGVLLYLLLLIISMSRRFSTAMENEEKLFGQLRQINENLEQMVVDRTRDIEAKTHIIEQQQRDILSKNQELIRSREEEKNMLKVIIHDLKAPFNKIAGLISISKMSMEGRGSSSDLDPVTLNEMISAVADEGKSLIEDLNTITFFESYLEDDTGYKEVNLILYLKQLIHGHQSYSQNKNIHMEFTSNVESYDVNTHPHALTRVVDNLISNAIKFSPADKKILVKVNAEEEQFSVDIKDEGPGFTKEDLQKIYHKFQRLSAKPTKGETSTGLGLNIAKSITDGLGGEISLTSKEGKGATFTLTFPRHLPRAKGKL